MKRRYRLLFNVSVSVKESEAVDLTNLDITFTPNLPKAVFEELKAFIDAGGELSQETLLGLLSFVEAAKAELDLIAEETKNRQTSGDDEFAKAREEARKKAEDDNKVTTNE